MPLEELPGTSLGRTCGHHIDGVSDGLVGAGLTTVVIKPILDEGVIVLDREVRLRNPVAGPEQYGAPVASTGVTCRPAGTQLCAGTYVKDLDVVACRASGGPTPAPSGVTRLTGLLPPEVPKRAAVVAEPVLAGEGNAHGGISLHAPSRFPATPAITPVAAEPLHHNMRERHALQVVDERGGASGMLMLQIIEIRSPALHVHVHPA
mmetsp:Transcript_47616/g.77398  ORF Transcript_47616/g.77398 Transcript_47616/m.77398 type:complete len:206 (+) Transcript_47616:685-1302(+)